MASYRGLQTPPKPDWEGLLANVRREGTPRRVFHMELFHDGEIAEAIVRKFDLLPRVRPDDPYYNQKRLIAVNRFVGFDYVVAGLVGLDFPLKSARADDTAALKHTGGRYFAEEHAGPITHWEEFERYPWPDPTKADAARDLEWFSENLPDDMCLVGGLGAHFAELLTWMMGYESLCFALFDQRDLVGTIAARLRDFFRVWLRRVLEFDRVKMVWGSDDMGFKTGLMLSPADMREFVLAGHREQAAMSHAVGRPYLLHACGNLSAIMDDLVTDVKIDAKHSFEDTIEDVREAKKTYGKRLALLGGVDVDFLCRSDEQAVRRRVRETLQACLPGGGYCLGTGNSVANYIPLDNYLAMVDEGRLYRV